MADSAQCGSGDGGAACAFAVAGLQHEWGIMTVALAAGGAQAFKDAKVWPGGARGWDWNETGTRHRPGVQPADVEELLPHADVVVLTRGVDGVLQVPDATVAFVQGAGKEVIVQRTPDAVATFNELLGAGRRVAGLFHSTC